VTESFLVLKCDRRETGKKKPFLSLVLKYPETNKDRPFEEMPAVVWDLSVGPKIPEPGEVISCWYKEGDFNGKPQLTVEKFVFLEQADLALYREPPVIDADSVFESLYMNTSWVSPDVGIFFRQMVEALSNPSPWPEYTYIDVLKNIPAGERNHHDRRGGLLQHIEEMYHLGELICQQGPVSLVESVNMDILLAAILLHDLGKICEYSPETLKYDSTRVGEYLGHPAWGMLTVQMYWPPGGDQHLKLRLMHAIISHHGSEVSEVSPLTPEAILLHEIDGISARMDVWRKAETKKESPEYSKMLKGTPITPWFPAK